MGSGFGRRLKHVLRRVRDSQQPAGHGTDVFRDIREQTGRGPPAVVLDVGANVGQASLRYAREFPDALIYSFEPVRGTFEGLQRAVGARANVRCFQRAMGATSGQVEIVLQELSIENSLRYTPERPGHPAAEAGTEVVCVDTLDAFCAREAIEAVDFLKVDAEGWDLLVLEGAEGLLGEQRIAFVQAEVGAGSHDTKHVPLAALQAHMEAHDYWLFGIYDQTPEWWHGLPWLRFCNAVFVSQREVDAAHARRQPPRDP